MEGQCTTYSLMALQQDLPGELPSWAFEEDVLGGFEDFVDITFDPLAFEGLETEPDYEVGTGNAPAYPELSGAASGDVSQQELSAGDPAANPPNSNTGVMRKQQKNREAQQRFRMRQRVSLSSVVDIDPLIFIVMSFASARNFGRLQVRLPASCSHTYAAKTRSRRDILIHVACRFAHKISKRRLQQLVPSCTACKQRCGSSKPETLCLRHWQLTIQKNHR